MRNLTPYIGELTRKLEDGTEAHSKKLFGSLGQHLLADRVAHPPAGGRGAGQQAAGAGAGRWHRPRAWLSCSFPTVPQRAQVPVCKGETTGVA